jgi:ribosomal protein S17E
MGRIKSTLIKRTSRQLIENSDESFGKTFPSKRMKNRIAGYITRLKRNQKKVIDDEKSIDNG